MNIFFRLFGSFSRRELYIFIASLLAFLASSSLLTVEFIEQNTKLAPISGGEYAEGVVGQPTFINPVLAANPVDRDLVELIFDDLADLAESYKVDESGLVWRYRLKEGVFWHDNEPITSNDVIFTVSAIQDENAFSPLFKNWQGVVVNRISEREIEFQLPNQYVFFKNTLESLRPIPEHLFKDIPTANLKLSVYNLEPIGSGPYKFAFFKKRSDGYISSYGLKKNDNYLGEKPYLKKISLIFFQKEAELIESFNVGSIDGFGIAGANNLSAIRFPHQIVSLPMTKYYAVFFNSYSQPLFQDKNVRLALNLAIDKKEIIEKALVGEATIVSGPLLSAGERESFSLSEAEAILEKADWRWGSENVREKILEKETVRLEFELIVPEVGFLIETAEVIKKSWAKIGVKLNVSIRPLLEINNGIIKSRNYQMILFGNTPDKNPDPFSFWHSLERFYPGLNLSLYENKAADALIDSIRKNFDEEKRQRDLNDLESIIVADQPAIFLYSPNYLYVVRKDLSGLSNKMIVSASERFNDVEKWYLKTARVFK